jgi:hypothetical protein
MPWRPRTAWMSEGGVPRTVSTGVSAQTISASPLPAGHSPQILLLLPRCGRAAGSQAVRARCFRGGSRRVNGNGTVERDNGHCCLQGGSGQVTCHRWTAHMFLGPYAQPSAVPNPIFLPWENMSPCDFEKIKPAVRLAHVGHPDA